MTTRNATFRYRFTTGHVDLCPDCSGCLVRDGEVAGDPREPAVTLVGLIRATPAPLGATCDTCASLDAYEEALNASRVLRDVEVGPPLLVTENGVVNLGCVDVAFGTPEEHARWHEIHDTPTLRELEGEDAPPPFRPGVDGDLTKSWD